MARTVSDGRSRWTLGTCELCGFDDGWETIDGRGNILCNCQACIICGRLSAYGFHERWCIFRVIGRGGRDRRRGARR